MRTPEPAVGCLSERLRRRNLPPARFRVTDALRQGQRPTCTTGAARSSPSYHETYPPSLDKTLLRKDVCELRHTSDARGASISTPSSCFGQYVACRRRRAGRPQMTGKGLRPASTQPQELTGHLQAAQQTLDASASPFALLRRLRSESARLCRRNGYFFGLQVPMG